MLEELAKRDKEWRKLAFSICKDKHQADDLVQEMYLRLHDKKFILTPVYVYLTIKSIFLDGIRKKRTINNELIIQLEEECKDDDLLERRKHLNKILDKLDLPDREALLMTSEMSLRDCADSINEIPIEGIGKVTNMWFHHRRKAALEKLRALLKENDIEL